MLTDSDNEEIENLDVFLKETSSGKFFCKFKSKEDKLHDCLYEYEKWQEFFPEIYSKIKNSIHPEYIAFKILKSLRKNV